MFSKNVQQFFKNIFLFFFSYFPKMAKMINKFPVRILVNGSIGRFKRGEPFEPIFLVKVEILKIFVKMREIFLVFLQNANLSIARHFYCCIAPCLNIFFRNFIRKIFVKNIKYLLEKVRFQIFSENFLRTLKIHKIFIKFDRFHLLSISLSILFITVSFILYKAYGIPEFEKLWFFKLFF